MRQNIFLFPDLPLYTVYDLNGEVIDYIAHSVFFDKDIHGSSIGSLIKNILAYLIENLGIQAGLARFDSLAQSCTLLLKCRRMGYSYMYHFYCYTQDGTKFLVCVSVRHGTGRALVDVYRSLWDGYLILPDAHEITTSVLLDTKTADVQTKLFSDTYNTVFTFPDCLIFPLGVVTKSEASTEILAVGLQASSCSQDMLQCLADTEIALGVNGCALYRIVLDSSGRSSVMSVDFASPSKALELCLAFDALRRYDVGNCLLAGDLVPIKAFESGIFFKDA